VELGELELEISELSPKEEGIAKIQGLVVNMPNSKLGDHLRAKITQIHGKTAKAQII
jgi:predicted RNA-binding protein with TRAM domain